MTGLYRLADLNIEITSQYQSIHDMCKDYCAENGSTPDFAVHITQAGIDYEREKAIPNDASRERTVQDYPDDWLETNAVHRQIAEKLPDYGGFMLHGSAVAVNGDCFVFTARSGIGKSTHTRLWRELLGELAVMVNDDKPLIRVAEKGTLVYGSPWDGKHHLSSNISVPLKAICVLERGEENQIREIGIWEMMPKLLLQVYRPMNVAGTEKLMDVFDSMALTVKFYRMQCNMDISAAKMSYTTMRG